MINQQRPIVVNIFIHMNSIGGKKAKTKVG